MSEPTLHTAPSASLSADVLRDLRRLMHQAFDSDFSEEDWRHTLGGRHVWLTLDGAVVSHGSVVPRSLCCGDRLLTVGYVEAVATVPEKQGRGLGSRVMGRIGELVRQHYALGALSTGAPGFYESLGWQHWTGPTWVRTATDRLRTPDDDCGIMVLCTARSGVLDLDDDISCDWRLGDVW